MKINPKVTPQAPSDGNETPQLSYAQMITEAIMQAENRILTLKDICTHIHQNYPHFCKDDKMWQAAVSRNLSKNNKFQKVPRSKGEGKGGFWTVEEFSDLKDSGLSSFSNKVKASSIKDELTKVESFGQHEFSKDATASHASTNAQMFLNSQSQSEQSGSEMKGEATKNLHTPSKVPVKVESTTTKVSNDSPQVGGVKVQPKITSDPPCSNKKPQLSYGQMISEAIMQADNKRMPLCEIYRYISQNHPYYSMDDKTFKGAIRHTLSKYPKFKKVSRSTGEGKGGLWTIEDVPDLKGSGLSSFSREVISPGNKDKVTTEESLNQPGFPERVTTLPSMDAQIFLTSQPQSDQRNSDLESDAKEYLETQKEIPVKAASTATKVPLDSLPPSFINFINSNQCFADKNVKQSGQEEIHKPLDFDLMAAMAKAPVLGGTGRYVIYDNNPEIQPVCTEGGFYGCPICNREFSIFNSLGQHVSIHTRQIQHRCDLCGHVFEKCDYLINHVKLHTVNSVPVYEEEQIGQTEPTKQLQSHENINTGEESPRSRDTEPKSYACGQCSFKTVHKKNLLSHIKTVHNKVKRKQTDIDKDKDYACLKCPFTTLYKGYLKSHIKVVHDKVKVNTVMKGHMDTNKDNSMKKFQIQREPQKHQDVSKAESKSQKSSDIETDDINPPNFHSTPEGMPKSFSCGQCSFKTKYKQNLSSHIRTVHDKISRWKDATKLECKLPLYNSVQV